MSKDKPTHPANIRNYMGLVTYMKHNKKSWRDVMTTPELRDVYRRVRLRFEPRDVANAK